MGMFFLVRSGANAGTRIAAASAMCAKMGFARPAILAAGDVTVHVYPKRGGGEANAVSFPNGDFIAACGTFVFRGEIGRAALQSFYSAFAGDMALLDEAMCHFGLILRKGPVVRVAADRFGGYHLFRDALSEVVSSSFLVAAATLSRATLTRQGIFEYVFNGVISGNETLFEELSLLPIGSTLSLGDGDASLEQPRLPVPLEPLPQTRLELIERSFGELDRYFTALCRAFGDRITCALSGGYDSRLILAMLRRCGSRPRVYVYGRAGDPDVALASAIAHGEGFALEAIDKEAGREFSPAEFPEIVARNYLAVDGHSWGGIFNNGAEQQERGLRVAGGAIALNGGGGEIFRNFFYLPDRRYTPRQLVWSFYAQFDPRGCTETFDSESYFREIERKMLELAGPAPVLERPTVEWLYHRFRCRSWDGRVDTINSQHGYTGLPFLNPQVTELASRIPIRWKHFGAFESQLIRMADARLAAYPSVYGYDFSGPPPVLGRLGNLGTYIRPPWLRRFSYRVKNRLGRRAVPYLYLDRPYLDAVLPGRLDAMGRFFRLEQVRDPAQIARILSLEYLVRQFGAGPRLAIGAGP